MSNVAEISAVPTPPKRVITYIDGFNLYFGMKDAGQRRYYWLDLVAMGQAMLKSNQVLVATNYFTSRVSSPPASVKRQTTYIEALQTLPNLTVFEGRYEAKVETCRKCAEMLLLHNEKMTDVNIAVQLTMDAHADRFDTAMIVTGDSDQTPTIRMLRSIFPTKRVIAAFPPERKSKQLRKEAHGFYDIGGGVLSKCQLPAIVTKADGVQLHRPVEWA